MQAGIKLFVFYLDGYIRSDCPGVELEGLDWFMSRNDSLILTEYIEEWRTLCPHACAYEKWEFTQPSSYFQKRLMEKFGVGIRSIAYVSDDVDFIRNALGSFSMTVCISKDSKAIADYGNVLDLVCHTINGFIHAIESCNWRFLGEGMIFNPREKPYIGKFGIAHIGKQGKRIPVVFAGRYFGLQHYRSCLDYYSFAIRKNKETGSRLFGKFDDIFQRLFQAESEWISRKMGSNAICSIPDHVRTDNSESRFSGIVNRIAKSLSLEDIQCHLHRVKDSPSQKSQLSATDRRYNTKGTLQCDISLKGKRIILLDDLLTSGATLEEGNRALREAGAEDVVCAVLAVNQYAREYWLNSDTAIRSFSGEYRMSGNASSLVPFFYFYGKGLDYEKVVSELYSKLDAEILQIGNISSADDGMF